MKILAVGITFLALATAACAAGETKKPGAPKTPLPGSNTGTSVVQDVRALETWYPVGEKVTFVYTVRNTGASTVTFNFSSGKQYDVWITTGGKEVYRRSRGMMYTQALTSITLKPGESKEFRGTWDQKDFDGKAVDSGWYTIYAQLTAMGKRPNEVSSRIWIHDPQVVVPIVYSVDVSVSEAINRYSQLAGKTVRMKVVSPGRVDNRDPNIAPGPPVTRSDRVVSDSTGSIYVTGRVGLDLLRSPGSAVMLTGRLARTPSGQIYLVADSLPAE